MKTYLGVFESQEGMKIRTSQVQVNYQDPVAQLGAQYPEISCYEAFANAALTTAYRIYVGIFGEVVLL